jgi:hypothetical protein
MVGVPPLRLLRGFSEMVVSFRSVGSIGVDCGRIQADRRAGSL